MRRNSNKNRLKEFDKTELLDSIRDIKDFIQRLEDEIAVKKVSNVNVMGFLAS